MARLTAAQRDRYRAEGFVAPLAALPADEVARCRARLGELVGAASPRLTAKLRYKPHLYLTWVSELVHHPAIVGAVQDVLGPDLLAWRVTFFIKAAGSPAHVAWHQDSVYWRLDPPDVATAWIALTDSTRENGCLRVVAGSHRAEVPHAVRLDRANMLLHGQTAAVEVPAARVTDLALRAGEMSLHHVGILHGSLPNRSAGLRAGLAIRYVAPHVQGSGKASATLVAGVDRYGHYEHEPVPRFDDDPVTVRWHRRAMRRYALETAWNLVRRPGMPMLVSAARLAVSPQTYRAALDLVRGGRR
jgi:hypothetical protein